MSTGEIRIAIPDPHPVLTPLWELFERAYRNLDVSCDHSVSDDPTHSLEYKVSELDHPPCLATTGEYPYYVISGELTCIKTWEDARLVFDPTFTAVEGNAITTDGLHPISVDTVLPEGPCTLTITKPVAGQFELLIEPQQHTGYFSL